MFATTIAKVIITVVHRSYLLSNLAYQDISLTEVPISWKGGTSFVTSTPVHSYRGQVSHSDGLATAVHDTVNTLFFASRCKDGLFIDE